MDLPYRPLDAIRQAVNSTGREITYAYEDLVFLEHNVAILKMGEVGRQVSLYFNQDIEPKEEKAIMDTLPRAGAVKGLVITREGTYELKPKKNNELDIAFH
jgi:hypothetical protein